jgi:hypothetical protein
MSRDLDAQACLLEREVFTDELRIEPAKRVLADTARSSVLPAREEVTKTWDGF